MGRANRSIVPVMLPEVKSRTRPAGLFDIVSFDMAVRMQSLRSVDFQNFSRQRSAAHSMLCAREHIHWLYGLYSISVLKDI